MFFTKSELLLICAHHSGTISETLKSIRAIDITTMQDKKSIVESVITKLSGLEAGSAVSLAFDEE